jgi:hypothetical protein
VVRQRVQILIATGYGLDRANSVCPGLWLAGGADVCKTFTTSTSRNLLVENRVKVESVLHLLVGPGPLLAVVEHVPMCAP